MAKAQKMIRCFNCGEELGYSAWSDPLDHCGKPECAREARDTMQEQRDMAHEQLDRDMDWR